MTRGTEDASTSWQGIGVSFHILSNPWWRMLWKVATLKPMVVINARSFWLLYSASHRVSVCGLGRRSAQVRYSCCKDHLKTPACVLLQDHSILTLHTLQFRPGNEFLPSAQPALAVAERQTPHLSHQCPLWTWIPLDRNEIFIYHYQLLFLSL